MLLSDDAWNITLTSTESSTRSDEPSVFSHPLYKAGQHIWYFTPPIILLLGNFGNIMTIIIMQKKKSGEALINIYFTALAVVDLITLDIFLLGDWVGITFGFFVHYQSDVVCKLHSWTIGSTTIGGWVLVSLTAHRAVSVVWPHRINALCSQRLVTGLVVGLAVFFAAMYSHYLYGYHLDRSTETGDYVCTMVVGRYASFVEQIFAYIDLMFYSVLPFVCILLANVVLVWKLRQTVRDVRDKFTVDRESAAAREKAAISVTVTIILVSVNFVVLTLPVSVYYISLFIYDPSAVMTDTDVAESHLTRAVTFMMMFCNSAVNFYLYCLTGRRFREEFVRIICPRRS